MHRRSETEQMRERDIKREKGKSTNKRRKRCQRTLLRLRRKRGITKHSKTDRDEANEETLRPKKGKTNRRIVRERECFGERVNMLLCQHSITSWPVNKLFDCETVERMHKEQKMQCYTRLFRVLTLYGLSACSKLDLLKVFCLIWCH